MVYAIYWRLRKILNIDTHTYMYTAICTIHIVSKVYVDLSALNFNLAGVKGRKDGGIER